MPSEVVFGMMCMVANGLMQTVSQCIADMLQNHQQPYYYMMSVSAFVNFCVLVTFLKVMGTPAPERQSWKWVLLRGTFGSANTMLNILAVLAGAPMGDVASLTSISSVIAGIMGHVVLGEPLWWLQGIAMCGSLTGAVLITHPVFIFGGATLTEGVTIGYLLALLAAVAQACQYVIARKIQRVSPTLQSASGMIQACVFMAVMGFEDAHRRDISETTANQLPLAFPFWLAAVATSFLLTTLFASAGAQLCPVAVSATLNLCTRVVCGYIAEMLFFGNSLNFLSCVGAALMIASAVLLSGTRARDSTSKMNTSEVQEEPLHELERCGHCEDVCESEPDVSEIEADVEDGRRLEAMPLPVLLGRTGKSIKSITTTGTQVTKDKPYKVVIIGMGPRGLILLERLLAWSRDDVALEVHCVDPQSEFGHGCHHQMQGDHLVINIIAEQLTIFTDESCDPAVTGPVHEGLNFFEWCKAQGLGYDILTGRILHGDAVTESTEITKDSCPPRALLGRYLNWCYQELKSRMPKSFTIVEHECEAMSVLERAGGDEFDARLSDGTIIQGADDIFLATGHTAAPWSAEDRELYGRAAAARAAAAGGSLAIGANAAAHFFAKPYPTANLAEVEPATTVAVLGAGLTMCDIVAELTVGRGGRFVRQPCGDLRYEATGSEPRRIYICSRSGVPHCARAVNEKSLDGGHKAAFITTEIAQTLRAEGKNALDFQTEVLPSLEEEMRHAYWISHLNRAGADSQTIQTFCENHTIAHTPAEVAAARRAAAAFCAAATGGGEPPEFLWSDLERPLEGYPQSTCGEIDSSVRSWLLADLAMARDGNLSNPLKCATDAVRDVRHILNDLVDFGGLSVDSASDFARFHRTWNRVAVGPPLFRNEQLLALHDAGIVSFEAGPGFSISFNESKGNFALLSRSADAALDPCDVVIRAQIDGFDVDTSESPLISSMKESGLIRRYRVGGYAAGGLEVAPDGNCVVDRAGKVRQNLVAMGPLCEGPNFYTSALPRALVGSRILAAGGLSARHIVERARKKAEELHRAHVVGTEGVERILDVKATLDKTQMSMFNTTC